MLPYMHFWSKLEEKYRQLEKSLLFRSRPANLQWQYLGHSYRNRTASAIELRYFNYFKY